MPNCAIVVVPPDWTPDKALGFSEAIYQQWHDQIKSGMRVLVFKAAPVNALVAEGEAPGIFARVAEWPDVNIGERPKTAFGTNADYVMPLNVLYMRAEANQVPLEQVREFIADPDFPNVEFLPTDEDAYHALTNWP
jgi:hypothetical protein